MRPAVALPASAPAEVRELIDRLGAAPPDPRAPIVMPIARCAGLCGALVPSRGDYCESCLPHEQQLLRSGRLVQARSTLPLADSDLAQVSFEALAQAKAVDGRLWKAAHSWRRAKAREMIGNLVLLGPSSAGKTAVMVALGARMLQRAAAPEPLPGDDLRFAAGLRYVSATALAAARQQHKLGSEAPLVRAAQRATLLLLDNLGQERPSDYTIHDVLASRHEEKRPTIVGAALDAKEFERRYGIHAQRLRNKGLVVDAHGAAR